MAAKGPVRTAGRRTLGDTGLLFQECLAFPSTSVCGQTGTGLLVAVPLAQVANLQEQAYPLRHALVRGKREGN